MRKDETTAQDADKHDKPAPVTFIDKVYRRRSFKLHGERLEIIDSRLTTDNLGVIKLLDEDPCFVRAK